MPYIRPCVESAQPILIKQIAAETAALIKQGAKILSLAQGSPNLPMFPSAMTAMQTIIGSGSLPYTDVPGLESVRETAAAFVRAHYKLPAHAPAINAGNVIITAGAAQAVYNCLALSVGCKDDVVLSPLPAYALYEHQTNVLNGTFDVIETRGENTFKPTVADLEAAFAKHTHASTDETGRMTKRCHVRTIVLCFPNNPAGSTLSEEEARSIADFLDQKLEQHPEANFSVLLDEVYIGTTAPGQHHSILSYASPRLLRNCMLVLSASKGLGAMPGARAGFLTCFDASVVPHCVKLQMACTANASIVSQHGLAASLQHVLDHPAALPSVNDYYSARTAFVVRRLNEIGAKYFPTDETSGKSNPPVAHPSHGTFYVFASFAGWIDGPADDLTIQRLFRDQYKTSVGVGVAVVPGCAFRMETKLKLIRFSCAAEMEVLEQAMNIIETAIKEYKPEETATSSA